MLRRADKLTGIKAMRPQARYSEESALLADILKGLCCSLLASLRVPECGL